MSATQRLLRDPVPGSATPLGALATGFFQVAYVTPDLDRLVASLTEQVGVDRFMVLRDASVEDQTWHGQPSDGHQDLAFGFAGNLQFEVIQPRSGPNSYTEFLDDRPGGGMHHTGILVDDYDTAVETYGSTCELVQTGRAGATRFAYFDTRATLGAYLEVLQLGADFTELFERIRRQEF